MKREMTEDKFWTGKEMKSLDDKINSCNDMLGQIILTWEELNFIDHITSRRLDQINDGEDDETDKDTLIALRKDLLPIVMAGEDLLKQLGVPVVLPVFRLKFFQGQLIKFNKIEGRLVKETSEKKQKPCCDTSDTDVSISHMVSSKQSKQKKEFSVMLKELNYLKVINILNSRVKIVDAMLNCTDLQIEDKELEAIMYYYQEYAKIHQPPADISAIYNTMVSSKKIMGWDLKKLIIYLMPAFED